MQPTLPISKRRQRQSGFTLLELMLAMMLGSLVLTVVYTTFSAGIDTQRRIARVAGQTQGWRFFAQRLRTDVKNLVLAKQAVTGTASSLKLRSVLPLQPVQEISYRYQRGAGNGQIRRSYRPPPALNDAQQDETIEQHETLVFENVERIAFRYLIAGDWQDRTNTEQEDVLPEAIECIVTSAGQERRLVIAVEVQHASS